MNRLVFREQHDAGNAGPKPPQRIGAMEKLVRFRFRQPATRTVQSAARRADAFLPRTGVPTRSEAEQPR